MTTPRQRFGIASVTGYPITSSTRPRYLPARLEKTTWYVLDRAYCHRVVGEHQTERDAIRQQRELNRWSREVERDG